MADTGDTDIQNQTEGVKSPADNESVQAASKEAQKQSTAETQTPAKKPAESVSNQALRTAKVGSDTSGGIMDSFNQKSYEYGKEFGEMSENTPLGRVFSDGPGAFFRGLMAHDLTQVIAGGFFAFKTLFGGGTTISRILTGTAAVLFGTGQFQNLLDGFGEGVKPGENIDRQGPGNIANMTAARYQGHTDNSPVRQGHDLIIKDGPPLTLSPT
jgi:hypothetical protein